MKLKKLIKALGDYSFYGEPLDFKVEGISCNSKNVSKGFIFVAIKGVNVDGFTFIPEALEKGAGAIIFQDEKEGSFLGGLMQEYSRRVAFVKVRDTRKALHELSRDFYADPSSKIKIVGITGTNGKTTVAYLIEAILKEAGYLTGVIGTVNYRFKDSLLPALNTTPGPLELQSLLARMLKEGVTHVAMEVSSHALDQERVSGIRFQSAIFTNLTQDHLDYHLTLDNYFRAKSKLFSGLEEGACAVINKDDAYGRRLINLTKAKKITYAIESVADIMAQEIKLDISHTDFTLVVQGSRIKYRTALIGRHNVYNILAAVSWGISAGIEAAVLKFAIEKFSLVPGRLERIYPSGGFAVFIDYAHTEDALKNVIMALREVSAGRIIVVFGCGGERDKTKRPKMGGVVSELADYALVTSDNPRSEDPLIIIKEIVKGIKSYNYSVILERKEAIREALSLAQPGDTVLVAGKGHEDYQVLKAGKIHFDDREVVKECLSSMR
jgi:UDP-N-acetylmuramoyl-L-alanyl-D-glutamate--2,6-diaminopimelate ligase